MSDYITIELSKTGKYKGKYKTIVDAIDAELADLNWHIVANRYACQWMGVEDGKRTPRYLHREIMERMLGYAIPDGYEVDHIDNNSLNNRRNNLRLATHGENGRNQRKRKDSKSGYKGVTWHKATQKWRARIVFGGMEIHLGLFDNPELAHKAYCEASEKYHGQYGNVGQTE